MQDLKEPIGGRCGRAYVVAVLGLPELNVFRGQSLDVTGLINDTGSGRAGTDVYADVVILGQLVLALWPDSQYSRSDEWC